MLQEQDRHRVEQRARLYRERYPEFAKWAAGGEVIKHDSLTQVRVFDLCQELLASGRYAHTAEILDIFKAADALTSAAMWVVVHMTYANRVDFTGAPLDRDDFKNNPQGHTGGSLNMVPAYVGYLTANALTGSTRSWLMGQGHCVAAVDAINVMVGNLLAAQADRYSWSETGVSKLVSDFYSYAMDARGRPGVPLGSHVNAFTAGGIIEGGYLGFAELQYVHMPLPGEHVVAFLSDGAFEEQRGSDWAPRWWRAEDSGLVTPIMIANGRRIDQRSGISQQGGAEWLHRHLELHDFHPITIDGRDPAAFVWGILESQARLEACSDQVQKGTMSYPVRIPYLIAETIKGFGFYGAGTNAAHGTPLPASPAADTESRNLFNRHAHMLFVEPGEIERAVRLINTHVADARNRERDHPLAIRDVRLHDSSVPNWGEVGSSRSPMVDLDTYFCELLADNPMLRVRVGNPDELRSNRMNSTLDTLKHRVLDPEEGVAESLVGHVITALNEEAVAGAALGNKGGINMVVTYEAFAVKMLGAIRQEIIFSRHKKESGNPGRWLSVPFIATSHLWENGKNEQSHQDPGFGEVLMSEMNDIARIVYPADANTAVACLRECYSTQGQIWALTCPKQEVVTRLTEEQAETLMRDGALDLHMDLGASVQLVAIGAYQLDVCFQVADQLREQGIPFILTYILEPGRLRQGRDEFEHDHCWSEEERERHLRTDVKLRAWVVHTRPEAILGMLPASSRIACELAFGYRNRGGTFDTRRLLEANGSDPATITNAIRAALA